MKKHLLAALTAALTSQVFAAQYYVVVPVVGRMTASPISVSLSGTALPAAQAGVPYAGFDFKPWLSVSGDSNFTGAGVTWSLASGSLPAGMALNGDGTLSGTPVGGANNYNFSLSASYKGVNGSGAYSLAVQSAASASFAPHLAYSTVFYNTGVNDYSVEWLVLTNTGSVPLTIQGLSSSGAPFTLQSRGRPVTTVAPGASANFNALFKPTAPGPFSGTVTVTTAEAGAFTVSMSGQAVNELPAAVDKTALDFGNVAWNTTSAAQVVTVKNVSSVPMNIQAVTTMAQDTSVAWTNEFNTPGSRCFVGSWLEPGDTCTVPVSYTPAYVAPAAFNLTIKTPGGTKVIPLTGRGI